jgi:GT2 family glycosyltransferase
VTIVEIPDLSICVVSFNAAKYLENCLRSLYENAPAKSFEIVIVDNASTDDSVKIIREQFPSVRLIRNKDNSGFVKANNAAIRASKGQYVLCLNSDTTVLPDALDVLFKFMESHPDAGACGPRLLNIDHTTQHQCKRGFPTVPTVLAYYARLHKLFPKNKFFGHYLLTYLDENQVNKVDSLSGAAMMVRRSVIDTVGMMDEDYFMYMDDIDWCYRIKQARWNIYYVPDARILHFGGKSTRKALYKSMVHFYKSQAIFYRKHYARYHYRPINSCVYVGIWMLMLSALTVNFFRRNKVVGIRKPERGHEKAAERYGRI